MLMITGQKPVLKSKQGAFQIIDTVGLFAPLTKFNKQVGPYSQLCRCLLHAREATTPLTSFHGYRDLQGCARNVGCMCQMIEPSSQSSITSWRWYCIGRDAGHLSWGWQVCSAAVQQVKLCP